MEENKFKKWRWFHNLHTTLVFNGNTWITRKTISSEVKSLPELSMLISRLIWRRWPGGGGTSTFSKSAHKQKYFYASQVSLPSPTAQRFWTSLTTGSDANRWGPCPLPLRGCANVSTTGRTISSDVKSILGRRWSPFHSPQPIDCWSCMTQDSVLM